MSKHILVKGLFLYITPVGAYYAVSSQDDNKSKQFLNKLLLESETPELNVENLKRLMNEDDEDKVHTLLYHCQKIGWVQGVEDKVQAPSGTLEDILPELLNNISEKGKVLLADDQGFYLVSSGFPHEVAEELSALAAEIANVHQRRSGLLMNNLGIGSHAWAIVDAFGCSQIGFWPIFIGNSRFVVAISGVPHLNQPEFVTFIWALTIRYAK